MEVHIPRRFNRHTMYRLLSRVIVDGEPADTEITFNFESLNFIEPVGCTVIANLLGWLKVYGVSSYFQYPKKQSCGEAIRYLDDSGFFRHFLDGALFDGAERRGTTLPLAEVAYDRSYDWRNNTLVPWMAARLHLTQRSLADIKVCFGEIFNNIRDHVGGGVESGYIFGQHFPNKNEVQIAISDFGVGIPKTVRRVEPLLDDSGAILRATEEGFTTKSTPRNRGAGLDILLQNVTQRNGGRLFIHSGSGVLSCYPGDGAPRCKRESARGYYPGTLFDIVFRTDTIENLPETEEEFTWI